MSAEEAVEVEGVVVKRLRNSKYDIALENGHLVHAYVSGKMRKHSIRILEGDTVRVLLSPYDLSQGRIVFRVKA